MILNVIFNTAVIVQILVARITAVEYDIVFKNEDIFSPCEVPNAMFLHDFLDMSELNFETLNNGSIYVHGEITITRDLGTQDIHLMAETFKKSRGDWVNTIYNMHRQDFCKSIFNPVDIWYRYMMDIPAKYRKCPFYKGQKFNFNVTADMTLNILNPQLTGDYKVQTKLNSEGINEVICTNLFVEVYRH